MEPPTERQAPTDQQLACLDGTRQSLHLLAFGPGLKVERHLPPEGEFVLGRGEDADVRIEHALVSRRHARLRVGPRTLEIEDLDSVNGTYVRDVRLPSRARVPVQPWEAVGLGALVVMVRRLAPPLEPWPQWPCAALPEENREYLLIDEGNRTILLRQQEIPYVEAGGNNPRIHLVKGWHEPREPMKSLQGRLHPTRFLEIHRRYIANKAWVNEIDRSDGIWELVLKNGQRLPIARSRYDAVLAWLARPV